MPTPNDEQLYLEATQEVDSGTQDPALWAKAMALAEGDEKKARYRYITLRVEQLSEVRTSAPPEDPASSIDSGEEVARSQPDHSTSQTPDAAAGNEHSAPEDSISSANSSMGSAPKTDDKPIPKGWVPLTGDDANKRIEKIRAGTARGIIVDGAWYVPFDPSPYSKTSSASTTRTEEGWVPLTGDASYINEQIERIRIGTARGVIKDGIWYVPTGSPLFSNSSPQNSDPSFTERSHITADSLSSTQTPETTPLIRGWLAATKQLFESDSSKPAIANATPRGIRGWLLIPAIGLVLGPIVFLGQTVAGFYFIQVFWPELLGDARFWLSTMIGVAMMLVGVVLAVLFFQKRRIAVLALIWFTAAQVPLNIINACLIGFMFGEWGFGTIKGVVHSCVGASIWIPYFLKSKRVHNTFIN